MEPFEPISEEYLIHLLKNRFSPKDIKSIHEMEQSAQLVKAKKRFYKLTIKTLTSLHITIQKVETSILEKAQSLFHLFPQMICRPLFYERVDNYFIFGQEFFDGVSIHECLEKNLINQSDVDDILLSISNHFDHRLKDSDSQSMKDEAIEIISSVLQKLNSSDKKLLQELIIPHILEIESNNKIYKRWTNGDLAGRNILVNESRNFRIIDYEYAKETHFYNEDWYRLSIYSSENFNNNKFLKKKSSEIVKSVIAYHYLNQINLDGEKYENIELRQIIGILLVDCVSSIGKLSNDKSTISDSILKLKDDYLSKEKELEIERILNQEKIHLSNNLLAENEYLKSKILSIQNSLSWKLLTPVRRIQKKFRKEIVKSNKNELGFLDQVNQNAADKFRLFQSKQKKRKKET